MINKKVVVFASIIAVALLIKNLDFSSILAGTGINNAINNYKKSIEKCAEGTPTWICKGTTNNPDKQDPDQKCLPAQNEGCLIDYREGGDPKGKFCYSVRRPDCGKKDKESTPTPTPSQTPTPTPTSTPTGTPTATPTPESTPTPSAPPNWCGGTCGSNYNCQGGLFCYQGYCRNPSCPGESSCGCVLGATTPPQLPKTGANGLEIALGLSSIAGAGLYIFRKFKLV